MFSYCEVADDKYYGMAEIEDDLEQQIKEIENDKERTKFNVHYKEISSYNLYQEVKQKLESNNIEYFKKTKTNSRS